MKSSSVWMLSKFKTSHHRRLRLFPSSQHSISKNQISVWARLNVNISEMTNVFNHLYIYLCMWRKGELSQQSLLYNYFDFLPLFRVFPLDHDTNDNREQWCSINICSQAFSFVDVPHVPSIAHRQSRSTSWLRDWN